ALQPAAAQDARLRVLGPIETFHAGRNARSAEVTGTNDLSLGVDLSRRDKLRVKIDDRPAATVSCAGSDPAHTLLGEITVRLTAQLGQGTAFHDGRFLHLVSPTEGLDSAVVIESLPPNEDAAEPLLGIAPRHFEGSDASSARIAGTTDLSGGVDLAALHVVRIGVDNGDFVEVDTRRLAADVRNAKPGEIAEAINSVFEPAIASDDGRHIILNSPTEGAASRIAFEPVTVTRHRRFVSRAFSIDDAACRIFGFFAQEAQGSASSNARITGKADLSRGVDLRTARFIRLSVDGIVKDIDCAGTRPRATLIKEVVDKINTAFGIPVASGDDGRHLTLTSPSAGNDSRIVFEPPRAADARELLFESEPTVFRGRDAGRVTFEGVADLSEGVDLPSGAAVKLVIDDDAFEIVLADSAPVRKTLIEIVSAINQEFLKPVAHVGGRHLLLVSSETGSASRIEFKTPSGTDSIQAVFGISAPRAYRGRDAEAAEAASKVVTDPVDLSAARFLTVAVNGSETVTVDCAANSAEPQNATLAEIKDAVADGLSNAQLPVVVETTGGRLILATTTTGATSRIEFRAYTAGDARQVLFGDSPEQSRGSDPLPAVITGDNDLLAPVNLAEQRLLRLAVDGGRPNDIVIAGAAPAQTFADEIADSINAVVPGLASITDDDRLRLTSPSSGEASRLQILATRSLELIEYPPEAQQDPAAGQPARNVRHGDAWTIENGGAAEADLKIILKAPHGAFGPSFVNRTDAIRILVAVVISPGEHLTLWRESDGPVRATIAKADGSAEAVLDSKIRIEKLDERDGCIEILDESAIPAALVVPLGKSEWAYLDCYGARFDRDRFDEAKFAGSPCAELGVFDVARFVCLPPASRSAVFAPGAEQSGPPVELRFYWQRYRPGAFTVNLPADLPARFGARFNQGRFAKQGDAPETFSDVVTEPDTDPDYLITRIAGSTLITAQHVERVPIGFTAAVVPFRKPRRMTGGNDSAAARLYLQERDVAGFIELSVRKTGAWGNAVAVAMRKTGPARFDLTVEYSASRFENARRTVLGGESLPALADEFLKPGPVGILQAKAAGVKATVTRDRAEPNE
ncbi:MAG: hypothetical protein ACU84J_14375, partial [Gammaproteobacteria bacterium]